MSTRVIHQDVWGVLRRASRAAAGRALVAVAYFGKDAGRLLRLSRGSRLVVDASEAAVKAGQTCPEELIKVARKGVRVFSHDGLHAKVYVFGRRAFIGSANVSHRSASYLTEALAVTTDRNAVADARAFVIDHCRRELTPQVLERLAKIYRPPRVAGARPAKRRRSAKSKWRPVVRLAQLEREDWSADERREHDKGERVAKERRKHGANWTTDSFQWSGRVRARRGDQLVQVTRENDGRRMVHPPGEVISVHGYRTKRGKRAFVYVELRADRRRKSLEQAAAKLGRGGKTLLKRDGRVRDPEMADRLLRLWD